MKRKRKLSAKEELKDVKRKKKNPQTKVKEVITKQLKDGTEIKYKDFVLSSTAISSTGRVDTLNNIDQGTTVVQRIGTQIHCIRVHIRAMLSWNANTAFQLLRIIVFKDLQQIDGTTPAVTDVLETNSYLSHIAYKNKRRWKVYKDETMDTSNTEMVANPFKFNIPINDVIRWSDASGTDICYRGIYILAISDSSLVNGPSLTWRSRITYTDK